MILVNINQSPSCNLEDSPELLTPPLVLLVDFLNRDVIPNFFKPNFFLFPSYMAAACHDEVDVDDDALDLCDGVEWWEWADLTRPSSSDESCTYDDLQH